MEFDDDGYLTSKKSVRSEHYEVKSLNPNAFFPEDKYVVRGSYKVEETDPFDLTTTSYETYDSPIGKKIAQALTNFGGKYDNLYPFKQENKKERAEDENERKKENEVDRENIESYGNYEDDDEQNSHLQYENYDDYGDDTKTVKEYQVQPDYEGLSDGNYNYGNDEIEQYISKKIYGH